MQPLEKGPSPLGINLQRLCVRNLSFIICTQTQSPGWKTTCLLMRLRIKLSQALRMRHIQILFKFPSNPLQELEQTNSKKHLIDWFKQLGLNQIHGGPLKELHMINAFFRLLKFSNNHVHEIGSCLAHYGEKIYYFPFSNTFPFPEEAIRETNQLFLF